MSGKILVVDDSATNRQRLADILGRDYVTIEAENGNQALTLVEENHKQLSAVLLNVAMHGSGEQEMLRVLRDNVMFARIPVIMVTVRADDSSGFNALSAGANGVILKPFNRDTAGSFLKSDDLQGASDSGLELIQRDRITGLYNREAFFERSHKMISEREPGYYILSCFDIDNFKLINDQHGIAEGDRILRKVGEALRKNANEIGGIGGRIFADNFVALYPAEKKDTFLLRQILEKKLVTLEKQAVTFSIGRYVVNDLSLSASAIYDRAFIAKQSVKGRYDEHLAYFDDAMLQKLLRARQITGEMESALDEHQFEAWFQPQYDHTTGKMLGAEALVRWNHPVEGVIFPNEFIPLFEQNGFIYELDKYIWRLVCKCLRGWLDKGYAPLPVSVNISRYDIFRVDLIDVLLGLLEEYNIPVELLRLEVTESAFTDSSDRIVSVVKQLLAHGFTIEIDDFGSGYSSLNTLKDVPAQIVKLDMRFLDKGDGSGRGGNILESVVRMTKWLGMTVIAEGVEEAEQANFLASIGCTHVQGYLYARSMPVDEYEKLLSRPEIEYVPIAPCEATVAIEDAFWNPKSIDSLVFNKYAGGACVYEFYDGNIELIRVNEKYVRMVFGKGMSVSDVMRINWDKHLSNSVNFNLRTAMEQAVKTGEEVTGEFLFYDLPGCAHEIRLRSSLRVIAFTGGRYLIYCTSMNIALQRKTKRYNSIVSRQLRLAVD